VVGTPTFFINGRVTARAACRALRADHRWRIGAGEL